MSRHPSPHGRGRPPGHGRRAGYALLELMAGLSVLSVAMVLVAQLAVSSVVERTEAEARLEAIEAAANVLEDADSRAWADLTPAWAETHRIPERLAKRLNAKLTVTIEPEKDQPLVKRVTAEVRWPAGPGRPDRTAVLVAVFAKRITGGGS